MSVIEIQLMPGMAFPESLYVDSNVLVAFFDKNHKHHLQASQLLFEAKAANVNLYISSLVLDEVWYALMLHLMARNLRGFGSLGGFWPTYYSYKLYQFINKHSHTTLRY